MSTLSKTKLNIPTAIGKSYLFQLFLILDGERFTTNFLGGKVIFKFLKVDLILSFASFIEASANQTISIVGKDLFESTSIVIKKPSSHKLAIE